MSLDATHPKGRLTSWKSEYLSKIEPELCEKVVEHAGRIRSPHAAVTLFQLGGALNRVDQLAEAAPIIEDAKGDASWTAFALRFSLADPIIASTVVSIHSPAQVQEVLDAVEAEPPDPELVTRHDATTRRFRERHGVVADESGLPVYEPRVPRTE